MSRHYALGSSLRDLEANRPELLASGFALQAPGSRTRFPGIFEFRFFDFLAFLGFRVLGIIGFRIYPKRGEDQDKDEAEEEEDKEENDRVEVVK